MARNAKHSHAVRWGRSISVSINDKPILRTNTNLIRSNACKTSSVTRIRSKPSRIIVWNSWGSSSYGWGCCNSRTSSIRASHWLRTNNAWGRLSFLIVPGTLRPFWAIHKVNTRFAPNKRTGNGNLRDRNTTRSSLNTIITAIRSSNNLRLSSHYMPPIIRARVSTPPSTLPFIPEATSFGFVIAPITAAGD